MGLDVFDQLKFEVDIQGNLPNIPDHEKLELADFVEQFTVTKPGLILSQGNHRYVSSILLKKRHVFFPISNIL